MGCMESKGTADPCALCGWHEGSPAESPQQLPPRTIVDDRYLLGRALGQGGFGITYLAWDLNLNRKLAVKEYFPREACTRGRDGKTVKALTQRDKENYETGLVRFLEEGQALARFQESPGVAAVLAFFRENGTGYIVMVYIDGLTFGEFLARQGGRVDFATAVQALLPVMDTLSEVHRAGLLHRDISPDNIYITRNGQVKLLDFGAARYSLGQQSRSLDVILKPGYAPEEQYRSKGNQGPWTDVYALGATLYRAITGQTLSPALDRLAQDDLQSPSALGLQINPQSEKVLLKALAVRHENRYQTIASFQNELLTANENGKGNARRPPPPPPPPREPMPIWIWGAGAVLLLVAIAAAFFVPRLIKTTPPVLKHPAIVAFTAVPSVITEHGDLTLHWETQDSDDVRLEGVKVAASGDTIRRDVSSDTIFHLTIGGAEGGILSSASAPVKVTIEAKRPDRPAENEPPTIQFETKPRTVPRGKSATVQWNVQNASEVFLDNESVLPSDSRMIDGLKENRTLHLRVVDRQGRNIERSQTISVIVPPQLSAPEKVFPPGITFTANSNVIHSGQTLSLHWSVLDATRVRIDPGFPSLLPEGTVTASPAKDTRYLLVAEGPGGTTSKEFNVQVLPNTPGSLNIVSFIANPVSVRPGAITVLQWNVSGAARVILIPGNVLVPSSGSAGFRPTKTTEYLIVASAPDGSSKAKHVIVYVTAIP